MFFIAVILPSLWCLHAGVLRHSPLPLSKLGPSSSPADDARKIQQAGNLVAHGCTFPQPIYCTISPQVEGLWMIRWFQWIPVANLFIHLCGSLGCAPSAHGLDPVEWPVFVADTFQSQPEGISLLLAIGEAFVLRHAGIVSWNLVDLLHFDSVVVTFNSIQQLPEQTPVGFLVNKLSLPAHLHACCYGLSWTHWRLNLLLKHPSEVWQVGWPMACV
mmetsp:Transcript_13048/g.29641  ORF Transcript_13048/g.29641 Transcript_13048/m.29641 type:complete len:216 (+) Transcript_13048:244-891(+)